MALKLGHINVDRMLEEISIHQLHEWRAYAEIEPFDEVRDDYRTASIVSAIYHTNRGKGAPTRPIKDFVLKFDDEPRQQQTWQQQKAIAQLYARAFNSDPKNRPREKKVALLGDKN